MIKIAFCKGTSADIQLTPYEYPTFKDFSSVFTYPQEGEKGQVGYFIRGGDIELHPSYSTFSGIFHTNIYPRCDQALKAASVLVIDADRGEAIGTPAPHLNQISEALTLLGYQHFGYTTSSSTQDYPKCRVVIPCDMAHKEQLPVTLQTLKHELATCGCRPCAGGSEEYTWSVPWFLPTAVPGYLHVYSPGRKFPASIPDSSSVTHVPMHIPKGDSHTFVELIATIRIGNKDTGTWNAIRDVVCYAVHEGWKRGTILGILKGIMDRPDYPHANYINDLERLVDHSYKKITTDWSAPVPLPEVYLPTEGAPIFPKEMVPESMRQAAVALSSYNLMEEDDIYINLIAATCNSINRKAIIQEGSEALTDYFALGIINIATTGAFKSGVYSQTMTGFDNGEAMAKARHSKTHKIAGSKLIQLNQLKKSTLKADNSKQDKTVAEICSSDTDSLIIDIEDKIEHYKSVRIPVTVADDITQEKAIEHCYLCGGVISYNSAEGQSFFNNLGDAYGNGGGSKTDFVIRGITVDGYNYKRKSKEGVNDISFRPLANINIYTQPDVYYDFISNKKVYSTGLQARLIPNHWAYVEKKKTITNGTLDLQAMSAFTDITCALSSFRPTNEQFVKEYFIEKEPDRVLVQPVTCIKANPELLTTYIDHFNSVRATWQRGGIYEGMGDSLNKSVSVGFIMAGCVFAYEHYDIFYTTQVHYQDTVFLNRARAFTKYIMECKVFAENVKDGQRRLTLAEKLLASMRKSKDITVYYNGIPDATYRNKMKSYGGNSNNADIMEDFRDAVDLLIAHNYLKVTSVGSEDTAKGTYHYVLNTHVKSVRRDKVAVSEVELRVNS